MESALDTLMERLEVNSCLLIKMELVEGGSIDEVSQRAFTMTLGRRDTGDVLVITGYISGDEREAACDVRSFRHGEPVEHRTVEFGDVTIMSMEID